jgi:hypothetical protein
MHLVGEIRVRTMSKVFEGFNEEKQRQYEAEATRRYGAETVAATSARWTSYSPERQREILEEGRRICAGQLTGEQRGGQDGQELVVALVGFANHGRKQGEHRRDVH